jgi:hypothetical protein
MARGSGNLIVLRSGRDVATRGSQCVRWRIRPDMPRDMLRTWRMIDGALRWCTSWVGRSKPAQGKERAREGATAPVRSDGRGWFN